MNGFGERYGMNKHRNNAGFTLMEVAVVLAVISMLLFSVIKGPALLHQGKVRKLIQQVEDVRTASHLFMRERGRLPGDGLGTGAILDGWIKDAGSFSGEVKEFVNELVNDRYLQGKTGEKWPHSLGGSIWVEWKVSTWTDNWIMVSGLEVDGDAMIQLNEAFDGDNDLAAGRVRKSGSDLMIAL